MRSAGSVVVSGLRRRLAERRRTLGQALPHRPHAGLVPHERRAGPRLARRVVGLVGQVGMQHQRLARVGEEAVVAGVEIALRRQALGEQDGMRVQLDVEILDRRPALLLADRRAVDQLAGADQLAVDEDRVIRRDQQIAVRHVVGERAALDADRRHRLRPRMRGQVDAPPADPLDRLRAQFAAGQREDDVALQSGSRPSARRWRSGCACRRRSRACRW